MSKKLSKYAQVQIRVPCECFDSCTSCGKCDYTRWTHMWVEVGVLNSDADKHQAKRAIDVLHEVRRLIYGHRGNDPIFNAVGIIDRFLVEVKDAE